MVTHLTIILEVIIIADQKQRVSRHNGRAGKHGVYNSKHNDRQFDVVNAENIKPHQTDFNLYWDWQNGLRTHAENISGHYPTFAQAEHDFYEQQYGHYLAGQTERNIKAGHAKRNRTVDDLLADARICPEETIYQIGKDGECPPPEVLTAIVQEFMETITERFGSHVHILDWALHLDETSPHIHARQVFDVENRYGETEPKQEKALEALDIPLPEPGKKPSKVNNRKVSFDGICRELLLGICREHGLDVETEAIYGGKKSQERNDYISDHLRQEVAELKREKAELLVTNEQQRRLLEKHETELDRKRDQLADADTILEAVSDIAYNEALKVVTPMAVAEAQKQDTAAVSKIINSLDAPAIKMKPKEKDLVLKWLNDVRTAITGKAKSIITSVLDVLKKPEYRRAAKKKIMDMAKPAVRELLDTYSSRLAGGRTSQYYRGDDAR